MTTKSPLEAARFALVAHDDPSIEVLGEDGFPLIGSVERANWIIEQMRPVIETPRPEMRVLTIPSAGVRIGTWEPRHTFEVLTELLATGYTFDEIEWEAN